MLFTALFSFLVGLIVMLASSEIFLNITKEFSLRWKLSPLFISLVITSLGTNLPELTVTIASLGNNDPGLAMGNLVGSSIANLSLILGTATILGKVRIGTTKTPKSATLLVIVTLLFSVLMLSSVRTNYQIILMVLTLTIALIYQYMMAVEGRLHEDKKFLALIKKIAKRKKPIPKLFYFLLFIGSLIGIAIGGKVTVAAVENLSIILGLTTTFLGLTLTAVATSLPELLISTIAFTILILII